MKILITSGATQEPVDGVRYLTNFSSGKTGAGLSEFLAAKHQITLIYGRNSVLPDTPVIRREYQTFQELNQILIEVLKDNSFSLIVHAAAISDYSISHIELNGNTYQPSELPKIPSGVNLSIHTRSNFKIIDRLKEYALSNPNIKKPPILVGFKLTNTDNKESQKKEVARLASHAPVDFIVHNDLHEIQSKGIHLYNLYKGENTLKTNITMEELGLLLPELSDGNEV